MFVHSKFLKVITSMCNNFNFTFTFLTFYIMIYNESGVYCCMHRDRDEQDQNMFPIGTVPVPIFTNFAKQLTFIVN